MIFRGVFGGGLSERKKIQSGVWCGGGGVREEVQHENFHALIQKPGTILIHRVKGSGSKYPES